MSNHSKKGIGISSATERELIWPFHIFIAEYCYPREADLRYVNDLVSDVVLIAATNYGQGRYTLLVEGRMDDENLDIFTTYTISIFLASTSSPEFSFVQGYMHCNENGSVEIQEEDLFLSRISPERVTIFAESPDDLSRWL